jgi:hypothetical protein
MFTDQRVVATLAMNKSTLVPRNIRLRARPMRPSKPEISPARIIGAPPGHRLAIDRIGRGGAPRMVRAHPHPGP